MVSFLAKIFLKHADDLTDSAVRRAGVDLACADCGGTLRLSAATDEDLDNLCCHMTLTIHGREG